ncbi:hypothetical protein J4G37_37460 [Microvirga sp. 3-52]|nr:hypothetical protein [Microvirga sp. 3-52]
MSRTPFPISYSKLMQGQPKKARLDLFGIKNAWETVDFRCGGALSTPINCRLQYTGEVYKLIEKNWIKKKAQEKNYK